MGAYAATSLEPPPPITCFAGDEECREAFADWTLRYCLPAEVASIAGRILGNAT